MVLAVIYTVVSPFLLDILFRYTPPPKTHENRKKLGKKNKEYEVNLVDADAKQAFINLRR